MLKRELWLSRWKGIELPTKFKNESVYQLQQNIKKRFVYMSATNSHLCMS